LLAVGTNIWLLVIIGGGVPGAIVGALLSSSFTKAVSALARARAQRVKHVPVDGAELYVNGVPMDEAQFRALFAAYQAELDELGPVAERNEWQLKQGYAAAARLAVITGLHPQTFPNLGDPDQAWEWYRDNNPYATERLPRRHGFRLQPPGDIVTD
jgi:soluble lytic murein transglycosylase-like protein